MTNYAETEDEVSSSEGEPDEDEEKGSGSESEDDLIRRHRIAAEIWDHESIDPFGSLGERSCPSGAQHTPLNNAI